VSEELVSITVSLVRPQSRGSVTLRSADPFAAPVIRANYLRADADVAALIEGVRLTRQLGNAHAYDDLRAEEIEPGAAVTPARELDGFIRQEADTIYHLAGTCRMGPNSDRDAVVDASLRGYMVSSGFESPTPRSCPRWSMRRPHAACVAIGEKCSTLISGR
jgi:choline dehydrogenase